MIELAQLAQRVLRRRQIQVLRQLLRDRAAAAHEPPARPVDLERLLQLLEVHALVLPERVVFGDEDGALQVGRDVAVADPPLHAARRPPFARASSARSSMKAVVVGFVV